MAGATDHWTLAISGDWFMEQMTLNPEAALDARIAEVLGGGGPWKLEPSAISLLKWLQVRKGRDQALQISAIAATLGMTEREVKKTVATLVMHFGIPIGGARLPPCGYFLIASPEDMAGALRPLVNELRAIGKRVKAIETACKELPFFEQGRMALEGYKAHDEDVEGAE
jgi:hypothetical protein